MAEAVEHIPANTVGGTAAVAVAAGTAYFASRVAASFAQQVVESLAAGRPAVGIGGPRTVGCTSDSSSSTFENAPSGIQESTSRGDVCKSRQQMIQINKWLGSEAPAHAIHEDWRG